MAQGFDYGYAVPAHAEVSGGVEKDDSGGGAFVYGRGEEGSDKDFRATGSHMVAVRK